MTFSIRPMVSSEYASAYELAWETFRRFQAKYYPEEGHESFYKFLYGGQIEERYAVGRFLMLGCYDGDELAGIGGMRDGNHISLMFTRGEYQRMGVARNIMLRLLENARKNGYDSVTLNSSPCGLPFYKAIGFTATDMEQIKDGIIYTPMKYVFT